MSYLFLVNHFLKYFTNFTLVPTFSCRSPVTFRRLDGKDHLPSLTITFCLNWHLLEDNKINDFSPPPLPFIISPIVKQADRVVDHSLRSIKTKRWNWKKEVSFRKQTIIFLQKNILQIISRLESENTRAGDEFRSHLIYLFDVMIGEIDKTIGEGEEKERERMITLESVIEAICFHA